MSVVGILPSRSLTCTAFLGSLELASPWSMTQNPLGESQVHGPLEVTPFSFGLRFAPDVFIKRPGQANNII